MVRVNVHQLHLVFADAVGALGFEEEGEDVERVVGAEGHHVVVAGALDNLLQRRERHAQGQVAVAAVLGKARLCEVERDERDVRVVHRLQFLCVRRRAPVSILGVKQTPSKYKTGLDGGRTIPSSEQSKLASVTSSLTAGLVER